MILAAVLLALVSCAPRPSASGAQDRPYSWTAIDAPPAPLSVPVSLFDVVYSREGDLYRAVVEGRCAACRQARAHVHHGQTGLGMPLLVMALIATLLLMLALHLTH